MCRPKSGRALDPAGFQLAVRRLAPQPFPRSIARARRVERRRVDSWRPGSDGPKTQFMDQGSARHGAFPPLPPFRAQLDHPPAGAVVAQLGHCDLAGVERLQQGEIHLTSDLLGPARVGQIEPAAELD